MARHPVSSVVRRVKRLALENGLPVGRTAAMRRLLRAGLGHQDHLLVVGHPGPVRQALPRAALDVVGVSPYDVFVNVVSDARGRGSLPRRWDCVVVTDLDATPDQLVAAADACLPGGVVAVLRPRSDGSVVLPGAKTETTASRRDLRLVLARIPV
jgi:hypothetical protein